MKDPNNFFLYTSCLVGAAAICSVIYVYVRQHTFKIPGMAMVLAGVILVGLPVWANMSISWTEAGFQMEFETLKRDLATLNGSVNEAVANSESISTEMASLDSKLSEVKAASDTMLAAAWIPEEGTWDPTIQPGEIRMMSMLDNKGMFRSRNPKDWRDWMLSIYLNSEPIAEDPTVPEGSTPGEQDMEAPDSPK
jgi:hypothetical protein